MNTSSAGSVPHCTWGSPLQRAQWSLPLNTDRWNMSLLQKPSIKESTAQKGSEQWACTAYNASHSSLTAAKTSTLASTGHGQTMGKKPKAGRGGKKICHSLKKKYRFSPATLVNSITWACLVNSGSIHKCGNTPRSHQLHVYRTGQIHGFRTVILLYNIY